jgi:methanogenic corrinoid protein MtbC1
MSPPADPPAQDPLVRIGELSRRTGVRVDTLRAWERRYGLLRPERSPGGFRLYVSAAEAARLAAAEAPGEPSPGPVAGGADHAQRLAAALDRFDEADANAILDDAIARFTVEALVGRVLLPVLHEIGTRWESGDVSVAEEHFATSLLRGRMLALGRNWGAGRGPLAVLACPPGEQHDLGLVAFETISDAIAKLAPDAVVLAAVDPEPFEAVAHAIKDLTGRTSVLVGGKGASEGLAERTGARLLPHDPVAASAGMTRS